MLPLIYTQGFKAQYLTEQNIFFCCSLPCDLRLLTEDQSHVLL